MQGQISIDQADMNNFQDEDIWIRNKLAILIEDTKNNYKNYRFDYAARSLYSFIWQDYCSWYIEISKSNLNIKNITEDEKNLIILNLRDVLKSILLLLHPIMPFITEEIYKDIFNEDKFIQDNTFFVVVLLILLFGFGLEVNL